ncbi:papain family cysteine protease (macronuclear) [Tetrahymena thermophila SB210]|uniref:Papain family cysteine protease n=1 Tax=Tetrahymena thermophila (strain SB210) TaxID=312017 RepID=Q23TW2_TETTS|nr:papain family cysteine protease [Tetrahymena thermophila SB210]EAR99933.1 papain family cysteine protease [Tetrahymena thermophila SB210]|eukprot:XP_001020178.1 papain family cysteine protease [Tetrahymena thermophila SB210]
MRQNILIALFLALCLSTILGSGENREILISQGLVDFTESDLLGIYQSYGYQPDTNSERYQLFKSRLAKIIEHNSDPNKTYTQGINHLTFQTREELQQLRGFQNCTALAKENTRSFRTYDMNDIPDYVDWREKGVVTAVKNQGECGSCWAFAAVGAIESHFSLKTGKSPIQLSEQQLIDCARQFDNHGCDGGLPSKAFEYIAYEGGIENSKDYPYTGKNNKCQFDGENIVTKVKQSFNITYLDEKELIYHLVHKGPVTLAYEAADEFDNYQSGIYEGKNCEQDPQKVNHAVLAVGYNKTGDYYIVKNSWGDKWGMNGYFYIRANKNACGLASCASYPIIE